MSRCVMNRVWFFGPPKVRFAEGFGVLIVAMCFDFGDRMMMPLEQAIQRLPLVSVRRPSGPCAFCGSCENIFLFVSEPFLLTVYE